MNRGRQGREYIIGYQVEIRKGLWERVKTMGAPRIPASLWLALCLSVAFVFAMTISVKLGLGAMGFWLLGHGVMVALTLRDPHWDDVLIAQVVHGYKAYYEAG
jgi:type IV secretory pathway TrbD component